VHAADCSAAGWQDRVTAIVADFLRVHPAEIDTRKPLSLYALDSLRAMELIAALEDAFERPLPEWLLIDHPDIQSLALALAGDQSGDDRALRAADSVLPAAIRPSLPRRTITRMERVLLTGATGFLGAHLAHTLLSESDSELCCLVRAGSRNGASRVRRNLEYYGLWSPSFAHRIEVIEADLAMPGLGLRARDYVRLAEGIDEIYHAAADVDWVRSYRSLRDVNVAGTRELLRLACTGTPSAFHFVSSLTVCLAPGGPAAVGECDDIRPFVDRLPLGYAQTKCVAETLVRQAGGRGLPTSIHRPSLVGRGARRAPGYCWPAPRLRMRSTVGSRGLSRVPNGSVRSDASSTA
jgi:nucleoside-diphosphate-sugar epimerase/acyl carrier protein